MSPPKGRLRKSDDEERLKQEIERLRRELAERDRQLAEHAKRIKDLEHQLAAAQRRPDHPARELALLRNRK